MMLPLFSADLTDRPDLTLCRTAPHRHCCIQRPYRGCLHRVEYGGTGHRNQPCVDRWCRTKAAQRDGDKAEKARRRNKTAFGGGGAGTKRALESRYVSVDRVEC